MIINHNMGSMNAQRNMGINSTNASKSMEKLSSGLRINKAGDDAAGLAISEKMRGQIRGLDQASANAQDGISMIGTAEGALNETTSILQRMRELAVQGANDTNTTDDRTQIQKEMNQLTSEVSRIGNHTEFNTQSLLKGGSSTTTAYTGGTASAVTGTASNVTVSMGTYAGADATGVTIDTTGLTVLTATPYNASALAGTAAAATTVDLTAPTFNQADAFTITFTDAGSDGTVTAVGELAVVATTGDTYTLADNADGTYTATNTTTPGNSFTFNTDGFETDGDVSSFTVTAGAPVDTYGGTITAGGQSVTIAADGTGTVGAGTYQGLDVDVTGAVDAQAGTFGISGSVEGASTTTATTTSTSFTFQIGANQSQQFTADITDMRSQALGISGTATTNAVGYGTAAVSGASFVEATGNTLSDLTGAVGSDEYALDLSDSTKASAAIKVLDAATSAVSGERAKLGAYSNRLEHTIANLGTSSENLTSAESRIRDVDMAREMSTFSKNNILSQAAQAMLAQANQQPQQVLQLLR